MAIILNDNINLASNKPLDKRFGPYIDLSTALNEIPPFQRHQGLVVGIIENGAVVDYWFRDGVDNADLISKTTGIGSGEIDYSSLINTPFIPEDISDLTDDSNLLQNFSFTIQTEDSGVFAVNNGTPLRLTGDFGITIEEDSSEGLIVSGPDFSSLSRSIVPASDLSYDLGSSDKRWKGLYAESLYLGTNTIFLGADKITLDGQGNLLINDKLAVEKFKFFIAGDDSNSRIVNANETIKFVGTNGISTATDDEGNVTITGPTIDLSPYATTSFVTQEISNLVGSAPETLNTLNELSSALNNDENFGAAILTEISKKLDKTDQFSFRVAGDDSAVKEVTSRETVKFIGGTGISTSSDVEGNIIIDGFSGDYRDLSNIPAEFSFDVVTDDSSSFTVRNGSALRLSGNLGVRVEGDSTEGFVISGPDFSALEQSLIPAVTEVYDLGSSDKRWKDLYLSGNTLEIGSVTIGVQSVEGEQDRLAITGATSLSVGGAVITALQNTFDLPVGSTVNGERLITRVELLENSFELNITGDDSSSRTVKSGETLTIKGSGGTSTRVDESGDIVVSSVQSLSELTDVDIAQSSLAIGKVLKYNGQSWVAANETGSPGSGSGEGDAATLNGFDGTHYLDYNNLNNKPDPYELPPATTETLGGVRIGENINVNNGTISVPKGAGINKVVDIPDVIDDELADGAILAYNGGGLRWETKQLDLSNSVMDGGFY